MVVAASDGFQRIAALGELALVRVQAHAEIADGRFEAAALIGNPAPEEPRRQPALDGSLVNGTVPRSRHGYVGERALDGVDEGAAARRPRRDARRDSRQR